MGAALARTRSRWEMAAAVTTTIEYQPSTRPVKLRTFSDDARSMGLSVWATKGAGKSRALGRLIAFQDFLRGFPVVVIDPVGGTIDNFLDKIARLPLERRT